MTQARNHGERTSGLPTLYVVATPLGNLGDITLRALEVLKNVDTIAAEDTRVARRLLDRYGVATPLFALHEHNEQHATQKIIRLLEEGKSVALVSDAGTPAVSDPGARAVAAVRAAGHPVVPLPGASAVVCALSVAGFDASHWLFYGFLPASATARRRELDALKALPYTLIFYEAPHRVLASVTDIAQAFGAQRRITIARELTKLFETVHSCALGDAAAWLAADPARMKGEFVLIVEGAQWQAAGEIETDRMLEILLRELPLKQAARLTAEISGARRNDAYSRALQLKKKS
ncbi:MAG TPA: 16S rRNA (cytidine(1402)-2'-O)-methyltransferase [Burkholderiales bacterium]|nr:16S rRNA (cytidine(1402)-2'-O)-methyltransferase [Burkholderiales bacterium]